MEMVLARSLGFYWQGFLASFSPFLRPASLAIWSLVCLAAVVCAKDDELVPFWPRIQLVMALVAWDIALRVEVATL